MDKIMQMFNEYKAKIQKAFENNKDLKLYLALAGAILIFGLTIWIVVASMEEEVDMLPPPQIEEENTEEETTENLELDEKALRESKKKQPPSLEEQMDKIEQDLKAADNGISTLNNNVIVTKQEFNENPPVLDDSTLANRDRDIRVYLKSIQNNIILHNDSFQYRGKDYKVGESFEGYQVLSINPIYVRFADNITALHYNLRFVEEVQ